MPSQPNARILVIYSDVLMSEVEYFEDDAGTHAVAGYDEAFEELALLGLFAMGLHSLISHMKETGACPALWAEEDARLFEMLEATNAELAKYDDIRNGLHDAGDEQS